MRILVLFLLFILTISCTNNNSVYWCGDHPCINKKEREDYFKKTMIVEIKDLKKDSKNENSDLEKLIQQAKLDQKRKILDEKEIAKKNKLEEKNRIKEEKRRIKQAKLIEKDRIKREKELAKKEKIKRKESKKNKKPIKTKSTKTQKAIEPIKNVVSQNPLDGDIGKSNRNFDDFVTSITQRNSSRPYPEINNIPR